MKKKMMKRSRIFLLISAFLFAVTINIYAQGEGDREHHDHGESELHYKHEDGHKDNGRHEGWYKHEDRSDHREYRRDEEVYKPVRYRDRDYYVHRGEFYERRNQYYVAVRPPIGFRITVLPTGYREVRYRREKYYVCGGMYFRFSPVAGVYIAVKAPF